MGRVPICTIGLGMSSAYPLSRIPIPPQKSTTFIAYLRRSELVNSNFRDGYNEAPAPFANKLQLLRYFIFQIPGKNNDIVRLSLSDPVRVVDRVMRARQIAPLLVRAAIHRV